TSARGPERFPEGHQGRSATSLMGSNPARAVTSPRTQPGSRSQIVRKRNQSAAGEPASRQVSLAALITCRAVTGRMGRCSSPSTRQRSSPETVFRPGWTRTVIGLLPDPCHSMHRSRVSMVSTKRSCVSDAIRTSENLRHPSIAWRSAKGAGLHIQESANTAHQFIDIERLVQEIVGPRLAEILNFVLLDHSRDADDLDVRHRRIAPNQLANRLPVDVRQHHIENDQVGMVLLGEHAGAEAVVDGLVLEPRIRRKYFRDQIDHGLVVVHDQDPPASAFQSVRRDPVLFHEAEERLAGNSPKPRSGNPKAFQLSRVEAAYYGLLTDFANLRCLASRVNGLHVRVSPDLQDQGRSRTPDPAGRASKFGDDIFLIYLHATLLCPRKLDNTESVDVATSNRLKF